MREISKPRLKAWLNNSRVWKVEMKGNHEQMAMGTKMIIPMPASYSRPRERTVFHKPSLFTMGFHATAICISKNEVIVVSKKLLYLKTWKLTMFETVEWYCTKDCQLKRKLTVNKQTQTLFSYFAKENQHERHKINPVLTSYEPFYLLCSISDIIIKFNLYSNQLSR
jgi:hypothetical protein